MGQEIWIKICPKCQMKNKSTQLSCSRCGGRLDNVRSIPEPIEPPTPAPDPVPAPETPTPASAPAPEPVAAQYQRQCPVCKKNYDMSVAECPDCHSVTILHTVCTTQTFFTLRFDDGKTSVCLKEGDRLQIARKEEHTSDPLDEYLYERLYVSRHDVSLRCEGQRLYLFRPQPRNPTLVNGQPINNEQEVELRAGDRVTLGLSKPDSSEQRAASFQIERKEGEA